MAFPFAAKIAAQPGPQTAFLRTGADICIYGGAALILEPLRHVGRVANFTTVFFRRTMPQITNPGALWDESLSVYPRLGGTRICGCASGAGGAVARSSSHICNSKPRYMTGRVRRLR